MKRSLILTAGLLLGLSAGLTSLHSQADNSNFAPKCKFNQVPVMQDNGTWECQALQVKAREKPQKATLLVPAVQKIRAHDTARPIINNNRGADSGMATGKRQHKPVTLAPPPEKGLDKPKCPKGQLPKLENGTWRCKAMEVAAPTKPQRASPAGPRPKCPRGELPRIENGHWVCKKPGYAPTPGKGEE